MNLEIKQHLTELYEPDGSMPSDIFGEGHNIINVERTWYGKESSRASWSIDRGQAAKLSIRRREKM